MSYTLHTDVKAKSISYGGSRSASAIKYIVIHYTGNKTDKAVNNAKFYRDTNTRSAGAHYFVDDTTVYCSIDPLKVAWAVGGSKYSDCASTGGGKMYGKITNSNSVSIEMCSTNGKISAATLDNVVTLTKKLMKKYDIPASNVYRHFDVTGKSCPGWSGWIKSNVTLWNNFKKEIKGSSASSEETKDTKTTYATVDTNGSSLNMRASNNKDSKVVAHIPDKAKVTVISKGKSWTKCTYKSTTGYCSNTYLKF